MVKLRKPAVLTTVLLLLLSALAAGSMGAQAATSRSASFTPNTPRSPAFSNPRVSPSTSSPRTSIASAIACDGVYDVVASPNGTGHNDIFATSVVSASDVWAVGVQTNASGYDRTLAEHWNGTAWSIVPTPNPGSNHNDLNGVAAISSNDVWAVGDYFDALIGGWLYFTMHWDGSSWTSTVGNYGLLFAVTALASNDVWAVGTTTFQPFQTLILHWNGSGWSPVSGTNPALFDNELFYVSAWSATDVWAVGLQEATSNSDLQSLAEHWNGGSWSTVSTPNDTGSNVIAAVAALEGGHAVGVGFGGFVNGVSTRRSEAWDLLSGGGSTASALPGAPGSGDNILEGVARSGANVWAVGYWRATISSARQTLAWPASWNSTTHVLTWGSVGASASPGSVNNALFAVAAVSPWAFWAVGYTNSGGYDRSLMESYCALHFGVSAPASTFTGAAFSLTVTAKNANNSTATGYLGTVHFTSTDSGAVLPGDYTFTAPDTGVHTFTGVVLNTAYSQTITVSDTVTPFITASATIVVSCPGACQAPTGTPGPPADNQSTSGAPGSRSANQSTGGAPPGPIGSRIADTKSGAKDQVSPPSTSLDGADAGAGSTPAGTSPVQGALAPGKVGAERIVDAPVQVTRSGLTSNRAAEAGTPVRGGNPLLLPGVATALWLAALLLWMRRRENRRLNGQTRP